jgi:hypothetical protein
MSCDKNAAKMHDITIMIRFIDKCNNYPEINSENSGDFTWRLIKGLTQSQIALKLLNEWNYVCMYVTKYEIRTFCKSYIHN